MTAAEDSAKVVEILKDTSSQTITLTVPDASDPEIVVEPLVAADAAPPAPRAKRQTDTHD